MCLVTEEQSIYVVSFRYYEKKKYFFMIPFNFEFNLPCGILVESAEKAKVSMLLTS